MDDYVDKLNKWRHINPTGTPAHVITHVCLGCCWDVSDESNNYCYKSAFQTLKVNGTQIELKPRSNSFNVEDGILEEVKVLQN